MTSIEILKTQINDGAFDGAFDGCKPVDVGDGFAVVAGEISVAVCSDFIGGTILLPWAVIKRVIEMMPNKESPSFSPSSENAQKGLCKVAILASKQDLQFLIEGLKELRPKGDLRFLEAGYEYPSLKRIRELTKMLEKLQREAFPDSKK